MTPQQRYDADLRLRGFHPDPHQAVAIERLQQLFKSLTTPRRPKSLLTRLFDRPEPPPQGLYLWGGVGRGKTYLMDLFHECLPLTAKTRRHFHRFMQDIHGELKTLPKSPDPLPIIAKRLAGEVRVLCLDEFHVNDIGDAMLLAGFLRALFEHGVTLITTSNTEPCELYKNGLQRERFEPAIELIQAHTEVLYLGDDIDYRLQLLERSGTYQVLVDTAPFPSLTRRFHDLAPQPGVRAAWLKVNNRQIQAQAIADDVVWFDFAALCETPRNAADYLEISRLFHTVLLSGVPVMDESKDDVAQRFIHLIDALYDHHVKLIVTATAPPCQLYRGTRHALSFQRTVSRLQEMGSEAYLASAHLA